MRKFIKNLLCQKGIRPVKKLGQNFLISKKVLEKIIKTAKLKPKDIILEIGPGIGILTRELAKRTKKVIAVEKDPKMIEILRETLKDFQNIKIVQGDILKIKNLKLNKNLKLKIKNYKLVSNLPYNIATEVIRRFLETDNPPRLMVVMVQKEVAERICSQPPKIEKLGVLVQSRADVKIIETVKKDCFWPKPKVDSVILQITPLIEADKRLTEADEEWFKRIVKAGFSHPRKQLINNLTKGLNLPREKVAKWLRENGIQPSQRAQTLSIEEWINLSRNYK